jgi:hypothetical protein
MPRADESRPVARMDRDEQAYWLAIDEAEELGLRLELWRQKTADPTVAWAAQAGWPQQIAAWRRWLLGDPDQLDEPPPATLQRAYGATPAEAAWRAIQQACDEG